MISCAGSRGAVITTPARRASGRRSSGPGTAALALILCVSVTPGLSGQIDRSVPEPGARTHLAPIAERYQAGSFRRWIFGHGYRTIWETPVQIEVLDLSPLVRNSGLYRTLVLNSNVGKFWV